MGHIFKKYTLNLVCESSTVYQVENRISNSQHAVELIRASFNLSYPGEIVGLICLDNNSKVSGLHNLSAGIHNQAALYPNDICRRALLNFASAIILFHTHPSGSLNPSNQDISLTRKLASVLSILSIAFFDHIIITPNSHSSIKISNPHIFDYKD